MHRNVAYPVAVDVCIPDISTKLGKQSQDIQRTTGNSEPALLFGQICVVRCQLIHSRESFAVVRHRREHRIVKAKLHDICKS